MESAPLTDQQTDELLRHIAKHDAAAFSKIIAPVITDAFESPFYEGVHLCMRDEYAACLNTLGAAHGRRTGQDFTTAYEQVLYSNLGESLYGAHRAARCGDEPDEFPA
jgi:hypothetical protein